MLFGSKLIRTLCSVESVLFDTVHIVFVLAMGCYEEEFRGVPPPINLKFSIHLLLSSLSVSPGHTTPSSAFLFSFCASSAVGPNLQSDDRLERAALSLFSSPHMHFSPTPSPASLYIKTLYLAFLFPSRFHLFNLISLSVASLSSYTTPSPSSTNLLFLYFCVSEALSIF